MGQSNSLDKKLTDDVEIFGEEVFRQARQLSEIATLSYEEFLDYLKKLNGLSQHCMDAEGKQLMFVVKSGTDSSVFWRSKVRIACVKINPVTMEIDSYRLMNLSEFLKVFKSLNCQYQTAQQISNCQEATESIVPDTVTISEISNVQVPSTSTSNDSEPSTSSVLNRMTASIFIREVDKAVSKSNSPSSSKSKGDDCSIDQFVECCICLDRTPNVMLPCAHSYCKPCIEKWNVNNKTCPVCREEVKSSDDAWVVISEAPNSLEVNEELCSTLMNILNEHSSNSSSGNSSNDNVRQTRVVRHITATNSTTTDVDDDDFDEDESEIFNELDDDGFTFH